MVHLVIQSFPQAQTTPQPETQEEPDEAENMFSEIEQLQHLIRDMSGKKRK